MGNLHRAVEQSHADESVCGCPDPIEIWPCVSKIDVVGHDDGSIRQSRLYHLEDREIALDIDRAPFAIRITKEAELLVARPDPV